MCEIKLYISFSHEFGFCARLAFFQQLPSTHVSLLYHAVVIFLSAILQTYAQPLCLRFSLLRHL
jgi:hypothetical protein